MLATKELLTVAALGALFFACGLECSAEAQPARVEAGQLCAVKDAIRWREPTWSHAKCERIAAALNATEDPVLLAAICTNESDLRDKAMARHAVDVTDAGLCGVRCKMDERGACENGPVKGMRLRDLLDGPMNISAAAKVVASKRRLGHYNAANPAKARDYELRIATLVTAFTGELRIPKGARGKKWARVRELAKRIVGAIGKEPRS